MYLTNIYSYVYNVLEIFLSEGDNFIKYYLMKYNLFLLFLLWVFIISL